MIDCQEKSDAELVHATLSDKEFFSCIIVRYEDRLTRYIRRITQARPEDVEDLLQEAFIRVYTHLNSFDSDLQFSSWIYRIVHNVVVSEFRKRNVRPEGHLVDVEQEVFEAISADIDIEKEIDNTFLEKHLAQALQGLPEKYRTVLILRFMEDKEYREISDIMQQPMGTVATLLSRAKQKLKKEFIRLGYAQEYGKE